MSFDLQIAGELPSDTIRLTDFEKKRKAELELVVEQNLEAFLKAGAALAELRNRRLYRVEFPSFESYVQSRFSLHRAAVDGVIRSAQTAQVLIDAGIELSPDTTAAVLRPISGLPDDELKIQVWRLAETLAPERVTQPLVARVTRLIRNALDGVNNEQEDPAPASRSDFVHSVPRKARSISSPTREAAWVRPLLRLSSWQGFSLELVLSHAGKLDSAKSLYQACGTMRERCGLVQERLAANYPELVNHA
jgi:hypothetical protein